MFRKEVVSHFLVTLVWLIIVSLLRWQLGGAILPQLFGLLLLWLGAVVGTYLLDIDHFLYLLVINPEEPTSQRVRQLVAERKIWPLLVLVGDTHLERTRLYFHSAIFQIIFYVFCFFVLTSTGSLFGAGLVMGMALHLLKDEIECILQGKEEHLKKWLFWQIKTEVSFKSQQIFVTLMLLVFLGLNLLLI